MVVVCLVPRCGLVSFCRRSLPGARCPRTWLSVPESAAERKGETGRHRGTHSAVPGGAAARHQALPGIRQRRRCQQLERTGPLGSRKHNGDAGMARCRSLLCKSTRDVLVQDRARSQKCDIDPSKKCAISWHRIVRLPAIECASSAPYRRRVSDGRSFDHPVSDQCTDSDIQPLAFLMACLWDAIGRAGDVNARTTYVVTDLSSL